MFSASNPWRGPGELLAEDMLGKGGEILLHLQRIIADWPRENTVVLSHEERHLRFILAVAGYPEVDVATRPFDWPLYDRSIEALRASRMLDNVVGMHRGTSLRSSLLNRDLNWRLEGRDAKELRENVRKDCLSLLFARTRQLDDIEISQPYYRSEEEAFLGSLHGYDSSLRRGRWWPKLEKIEGYSKILDDLVPAAGPAPEGGPRGQNKDEFARWKKEDRGPFDEWKKWDKFTMGTDAQEMTYQFHYVQRWISSVVPGHDGQDGTVQRFLRGASIMLELVVAEVRHRIAQEIGIGSITVDGGGRVNFLCPRDDMEDMKTMIMGAPWQFLTVINAKGEGSFARNNIRFESTIDNWAKACFRAWVEDEKTTVVELREGLRVRELKVSGLKEELVARLRDDRWRRRDAIEWFKQVQSMLPAFSINESATVIEQEDLVPRLKSLSSPQIIKGGNARDPQRWCWFCNNEPPHPKPNSIDSYMGIDGSLDNVKSEICPVHRLLYFLGHDQRLKDSTLRPPTEPIYEKFTVVQLKDELRERGLPVSGRKAELIARLRAEYEYDPGGSRPTTAIARIDANSLGILFRERHKEIFGGEEFTVAQLKDVLRERGLPVSGRKAELIARLQENCPPDRRRRRSFRFNAHWWQSIQSSVNKFGMGDRVAAWVTAGDDVVLAEYGIEHKGPDGRGEKLQKTLKLLAEEIGKFDKELDHGMLLSFGAGVAIKSDNREDSDRIAAQLPRSMVLEKSAKYIWKKIMNERNPQMMTLMVDGKEVKKTDWGGKVWGDPSWDESRIGTTNSTIMVEEKDSTWKPPKEKTVGEEDFSDPEFDGWDQELVERIFAYPSFSLIKDDERFECLKRHYVETWPNGNRTLVVLVPKPETVSQEEE